jgi:hypothetical protein
MVAGVNVGANTIGIDGGGLKITKILRQRY